jgi:hypothetical protein
VNSVGGEASAKPLASGCKDQSFDSDKDMSLRAVLATDFLQGRGANAKFRCRCCDRQFKEICDPVETDENFGRHQS